LQYQLVFVLNKQFSLKKANHILIRTELLIMSRTELFQFGLKTVGYGSVFKSVG
jgi:hypothetical protein